MREGWFLVLAMGDREVRERRLLTLVKRRVRRGRAGG
jgi:hypothetical protein